jgi:hypothetical protein
MDDEDVFEDMLDESGRLRFHTTCPSGHPTIQAFTPRELQDAASSDGLMFQCLYCGERWRPSGLQLAALGVNQPR